MKNTVSESAGLRALILCSVSKAAPSFVGGCRVGTAVMTLGEACALFGEPTDRNIDGKVKMQWILDTPRGKCTLYDYWWNGRRELSIGGSWRPARWLAAYLRRNGYQAALGRNGEKLRGVG